MNNHSIRMDTCTFLVKDGCNDAVWTTSWFLRISSPLAARQGQGKTTRSTADHLEAVRWLQVYSIHVGLNNAEGKELSRKICAYC